MKKNLGLIINPVAGLGGTVGLKGSDGLAVQKEAQERGALRKAGEKAGVALVKALPFAGKLTVYTGPGEMGAELSRSLGLETIVLPGTEKAAGSPSMTSAEDTKLLARQLAALPVDMLLFAGGDGTARDISDCLPKDLPVIGVPAGVKIHSAVYATSPEAAGRALCACLEAPVSFHEAEVMDIDEDAYRAGRLEARLYGYLAVPSLRGVMQHPKAASHLKSDDLGGICHELADRIAKENDPSICYIFGAGSTIQRVLEHLGLAGTLLGIDVVQNGKVIVQDATEADLLAIASHFPCRMVITVIGGQGHVFGRGNQQLSPAVIRSVGLGNLWIAAAASKIYSLAEQSLFVDTGDESLNTELRGYLKVIVGYQESLVCRVL